MNLSKLTHRRNKHLENCLPIILIILFCIGSFYTRAQKLDSLKSRLLLSGGREKCLIYHQIAYELVDVEPVSALKYCEESIRCSRALKDTLQLVRGIQLKAVAFRRTAQIDSSNKIILSILPIAKAKGYRNELKQLLHGLGLGYLYMAEFDKALKYNLESLQLRKQYGTGEEIASTCYNIGLIYYKLADYERALDYYSKALKDTRAVHSATYRSIVYSNIALCYAYTRNNDLALTYVDKVLQDCQLICSDSTIVQTSFCQGVVALNTADTVSAKKYFLTSYAKALKVGDERLQLDNIVYISRLYLATGHLDEAEHYLLLAESLLQKGIPYSMEQMKIYIEFAELFERKGDFRKVAEFQRRHMALKDSIYDDDVTTKLMRLEAERVEKEKNAEIETQNEFLRLNEKILQRQRIATFLGFSTALLFVGMVFVQVRRLRERKRKNADLEHRVKARTQELEVIVHNSHKAVAENRMWMDKILRSVRHATHTVNGLSTLAGIDDESRDKCIQLIDHEMAQLLLQVSDYAGKSETTEDI